MHDKQYYDDWTGAADYRSALVDIMQKKQISMNKLAQTCEISHVAISNVLNRKCHLGLDTLLKVCHAINIELRINGKIEIIDLDEMPEQDLYDFKITKSNINFCLDLFYKANADLLNSPDHRNLEYTYELQENLIEHGAIRIMASNMTREEKARIESFCIGQELKTFEEKIRYCHSKKFRLLDEERLLELAAKNNIRRHIGDMASELKRSNFPEPYNWGIIYGKMQSTPF